MALDITSAVKDIEKQMHACLPIDLFVLSSISPLSQFRTPFINGTAPSGLGLPAPINLKQSLSDMPTGKPNVDRSLIETPSPG